MLIQINYESETLLPAEIESSFIKMIDDINQNKYEPDKIYLSMSRTRGDIIRWIANNSEVIK